MVQPRRFEDLATCALFGGVPAARRDELARGAVRVELAQGEPLFDEGSEGHEFVLVVEGRVIVDHGGDVVASLQPGDYLGEAALLDHAHRNAGARAACDDTVVLCIGQDDFKTLVGEFPAIGDAIRATARERSIAS